MQKRLKDGLKGVFLLFFLFAKPAVALNPLYLSPRVRDAIKACRLHLRLSTMRGGDVAVEITNLKHVISQLPHHLQGLFDSALNADKAPLKEVNEDTLKEFSSLFLSRLSKEQRKKVYPHLKWDPVLVQEAEKLAAWQRGERIVGRSLFLVGGTATAYILGKIAYLLAGSVYDSYSEAIDEIDKLKKKSDEITNARKMVFDTFYSANDADLFKSFKIGKDLSQLPDNVIIHGLTYVKKNVAKGDTGAMGALYDLQSGKTSVGQIFIQEEKVKNVHEGYSVTLVGENLYYMTINFNEEGRELPVKNENDEVVFEGGHPVFRSYSVSEFPIEQIFYSVYSDEAGRQKAAPALASPIKKPETSFDKEYAHEFRLKNSGVAVVDSGIDYSRQDLMSSVLFNKDEVPNDGIDNDNNGLVDDYVGYNFDLDTSVIHSWKASYHGSQVAEVISKGSQRVKILPFATGLPAIVNGDIKSSVTIDEKVIQSVRKWNRAHKDSPVRVINLSMGGTSEFESLKQAKLIKQNPDLFFVVAAGNDREGQGGNHSFPAEFNYENVISVGAIDKNGVLAKSSGHGPNVDYVALGVDVPLKNEEHLEEPVSGTSFSAPKLSLFIAQMLLLRPHLTAKQIKTLLDGSVVVNAKRLDTRTGGVIDETLLYENTLKVPE